MACEELPITRSDPVATVVGILLVGVLVFAVGTALVISSVNPH